MPSIAELYSLVYEKLQAISARYETAESQLSAAYVQDEAQKQKRIENLQFQLKKIEEYRDKVDYFRNLAEKHLESKNILTITPRELNFNRLRNWAMMIDPNETDDPYAKRIYVQAKCNEMFLDQKYAEFTSTLEKLTGEDTGVSDDEQEASVRALKTQLIEQCRAVLESEEFSQLSAAVSERHTKYTADPADAAAEGEDSDETVGFGVYAQTLPVFEELRYAAKAKLGEYYDAKSSSILLPAEYPLQKEMLFAVGCSAAKAKKLYRGIQNYLLNIITKSAVGSRRIYFLDALHFNNSALGYLRPLEDSVVLAPIPKDAEQIVDSLKEIVSSFSDIDELLGMADSVEEYNISAAPEERIRRTVLVLVGYPSAFGAEAKEYIRRILLNYEHYGVTPILVDTQFALKQDGSRPEMVIDAEENVFRIQMMPKKEMIAQNNGAEYHFRWYELDGELPESFVSAIRDYDAKASVLGSEYVKRIDMEQLPPYERGKKSITLPYGIDAKDEVHSLSFDNENFAAYLMGASGSGKSTLLHTLITGIMRNYHPDDVELWLADFKMSEFAQYIDPLPPHVKYILLDESPELVYDLIDRLTEKMMERQRFFMQHRDMKKVENVPKDIYMPVIFVILDEFSIMSQSVSESEVYKLRLQNLLAKGRALGIKFIFASQTFTKGVAGLTNTAKDQIQTRIAMKNSYSEINETLELSMHIRTDQVRNWMEALPPHYALSKYREGDSLRVKRLQVMYFKGKGDEALAPQKKMIQHLNSTMRAVDVSEYNANNLDTFVDKHPVIVDGNSYKAFSDKKITAQTAAFKAKHTADLSDDDIVITFGSPRRMVNAKFAAITNESRENLLLVARGSEQSCAMSVILTAMRSFQLQNGNVHIWAYNKNRLYRAYRDSHFTRCQVAEGMDAICMAIAELKEKIAAKRSGRDLIVMLGMEQICSDFSLIDFDFTGVKAAGAVSIDAKRYEAQTEEELQGLEEVMRIQQATDEIAERIEEEGIEQGKSAEEIMAEIDRAITEFMLKQGAEFPEDIPPEKDKLSEEEPTEEETVCAAYNASEDLKYIIRQGSRFGYHFMLCLNDLADIRNMPVQQDLFRHKIAFLISADDSIALFASKAASKLPEHICQYSDALEQYSLRPFIHEGVSWDGWEVDADGEAVNSVLI